MSISIYTYSNPYEIKNEPYWDSIKMGAHFCVSQTMVNGLEAIYDELKIGQLSTVEFLAEALYGNWDDTKTFIAQYAALSDILDRAQFKMSEEDSLRVKQSLKFNKKRMLDSLRLLFEMNIVLDNVRINRLTEEQKYLIAAYKMIINSEYKDLFTMQSSFKDYEIDNAIKKALHSENDKKGISIENVDCETVIFHGIHQFTPEILNIVEQVSKYKRVVMMFNYQEQYREIYQTWLDVYSCFDLLIKNPTGNEFHPNSLLQTSYKGNLLGDTIAKLANGDFSGKDNELSDIKVLEFDNITEFSAYVAEIYEKAKVMKENEEKKSGKSALSYMSEQFYAAENSVNDILKVYFPEQFGERHFLAYPIGHFFVAVTNMWDSERGGINIENLNDVAECLYSEALPEKAPGALITTFNATKNYFSREDTKTIEGIISLLEKLRKQKKKIENGTADKNNQLGRLSYFNVPEDDINDLINALELLDKITKVFYADFESDENNFKQFYAKVREFVEQQILPGADAEDEFKDIIVRLLARLDEVKNIDVDGSFDCLKDTMSYYLKQESKKGQSANWIVRDFQQIDGDVLQSLKQEGKTTYHFACVSDADMNVKREDQFPWPLDTAFFESAYEPLDWKYQVYIKSRREYKHFKRYALLYGLVFNRCDFKISYVKNNDDKENELYYLLRLLGIETDPRPCKHKVEKMITKIPITIEYEPLPYKDADVYKRKMCAYKFALESLIDGDTRYKDLFLQKKYFEVVLINNVRVSLAGQMASDDILSHELEGEAEKLSRYFRFVNISERMDIITNARAYITSTVLKNGTLKQFPQLNATDVDRMKKREMFLALHLEDDNGKNVMQGKLETNESEKEKLLSQKALKEENFEKSKNIWCQWCASREICLEAYSALNN